MRLVVYGTILLALTGCAGQAKLIEALAKDQTTSCADLSFSYLALYNTRIRWYRTGARELGGPAPAESTIGVKCREDGMEVTRSRNVEAPKP